MPFFFFETDRHFYIKNPVMATDSLKLPPIPVPRGRSPGSSPDVRRRSKEREQQRKLRSVPVPSGDHHGIGLRLPRLFRNRSMSTTASYLTHSLTNLSEITGAESSDDGGIDMCPSPNQDSRKASRNHDYGKWPVMKTLSAASAKQHAQQHLHQTQASASSTPGGRRSPKGTSPQATPTSLTAPSAPKQRSKSHSHKFPFTLAMTFGTGADDADRQTNFKNVHDAKGNWIGFVQRKPPADGQPAHAWNNQNTFFTRTRSADDILQLFVDDLLEA